MILANHFNHLSFKNRTMAKHVYSVFLIVYMLCASLSCFSQIEAGARGYQRALGGRLGFVGKHQTTSDIDFAAFSFKNFFTPQNAWELNMGWGARSASFRQVHQLSLSASYQLHFPIGNTGLKPYLGGGAAIIYATRKHIRYGTEVGPFFPAFYPVLGIDYKSKHRLNMAIDVRPMTRLLGKKTQQFNKSSDFSPYAGLSFRRTF